MENAKYFELKYVHYQNFLDVLNWHLDVLNLIISNAYIRKDYMYKIIDVSDQLINLELLR